MTRVSIAIPSYNHEKFIRECIQSALDQTYQDFEIIITDDGSSDRTVEIIREFNDPRIKFGRFLQNKGACTAVNNCIKKAQGQYVAILNSDDVWEPDKLEKQVTYLDKHSEIGAIFTKAAFINESSRPVIQSEFTYRRVFEKENRTRFQWLRQFFFEGNCLCLPSVLIRKQCCDTIGLFNERMANLPDLDMWVRLCFRYEIHILNENLIRFRVRDKEANASGNRLPTYIRAGFEFIKILNHYLDVKDKELLLAIFPEAERYGKIENNCIPYFLGRLALDSKNNSSHVWALELLYELLGRDDIANRLVHNYGFGYRNFHDLTAKHDIFNLEAVFSQLPDEQAAKLINPANQSRVLKMAIRLHRILIKIALKFIR